MAVECELNALPAEAAVTWPCTMRPGRSAQLSRLQQQGCVRFVTLMAQRSQSRASTRANSLELRIKAPLAGTFFQWPAAQSLLARRIGQAGTFRCFAGDSRRLALRQSRDLRFQLSISALSDTRRSGSDSVH
jgi:hypothetical protein